MDKKLWISIAAIFVLSMAIGFFVHGFLLMPMYQELGSLVRTPQEQGQMFPFMLLAHLCMAYAFVAVYRRGKEAKPFLGQGMRYGALIAVLVAVPWYLIYYAVQPLPAALVYRQILFDSVGFIVMGIVVAWINK